jgi:soluble lytic murein transglycosylase-like protein
MKKLTAAAALLAACMTTFAAHSQEAPARMQMLAKAVPEKPADKQEKVVTTVSIRTGRQLGAGTPVDTMTTASVAPTVDAVARASSGGRYDAIVSRYASSYGVPVSLAHAVIFVESNYRANARGSAGEIGLMQIKPGTARMMGYSGSSKGLFNPETNIKYGMKYLAMAHKLGGGSTCGTILKYNAGHAARRMNPVSSAYCSKVKRRIGG